MNKDKKIFDNSLAEALITAGVGVWKGNFTKKYYRLFNYKIFGFEDDMLGFEDFISFVRPDYRDFVLSDVASFILSGVYERIYPIVTTKGEQWINAKSFKKEVDENGDTIIWGIFKEITEQKTIDAAEVKRDLLNVIHKQNNISSTFVPFLTNADVHNNVLVVLKEIITFLRADRCLVYEYDNRRGVQSCIFEAVSDKSYTIIDRHKNMPADPNSWWNRKILVGSPIIINDVDELSEAADYSKQILKGGGVGAVIAIPLPSKSGIWGYLCLNVIGKSRKWTNLDYQWLSGTANILGVCLELHRHENMTNTALAIQESRDMMMNQMFENSPVGISLFDDNGLFVRGNQACAQIYGIKNMNDVIGVSIYDYPFLNKDTLAHVKKHEDQHLKAIFDKTKVKGCFESDISSPKELSIHIAPIFDIKGLFSNFLMLTVDNTEINNLESKMSDFESIFSVVSDYSKIGYAKLDLTTKEAYATKQWYLNWSENEEDSVFEVIKGYNHIHPDDRLSVINFAESVRTGKEKPVLNKDVRVENGSGGWKWIHITTVLSTNHFTKHRELISVTIDVTKEKESEMMLVEAKNKAETMDRLKSAFLANMSHEIRTPLNAIIGFAALLTSPDFATADDEEKQYYGSIIKENSDLLLQLISDILDLSKIEAGTLDFFYTPVDINSLCTDLYQVHKSKTQEGVSLLLETPEKECVIRSDKNRIMQIIINFLTNAIKFTTHGSITIGYKIVDSEIEFFVQDTGMGISDFDQKHVFDSFVKLNNSIKGTGLGLAICKSIAEQMGGSIGVSSKLKEGSRFWFRLPCILETKKQDVEEVCSEVVATETVKGKKPTILVCEDSESSYILITTTLKKKYDVKWAQNGAIALDMFKEKKPDLVIMDVRMPEMDGHDATRAIRKIDQKVPIICLTAFAFSSDRESAIQAGCNEFLTKPISPVVLKDVVRKLLKEQ